MFSLHENHTKVIVGHLAGRAQSEIRRYNSARTGKLTFTAVDPPHHRAMLKRGVGTLSDEPLPNRAEA